MIKLLGKILKLILIVVILLGGSIFAYQQGWIKSHPLSAQIKSVQEGLWQELNLKSLFSGAESDQQSASELDLKALSHNAGEQIKLMSERALEAGNVAKDFVEGSVQVDEAAGEEKKLSEKASEYGQYLYCQAVVEDWEKQHSAVETSEKSASSSTKTSKF